MFTSRYMPCSSCGASVERHDADSHRCDPERALSFQMFALRGEVASFEARFHSFLDAPIGQFERWLAWRHVTSRS